MVVLGKPGAGSALPRMDDRKACTEIPAERRYPRCRIDELQEQKLTVGTLTAGKDSRNPGSVGYRQRLQPASFFPKYAGFVIRAFLKKY